MIICLWKKNYLSGRKFFVLHQWRVQTDVTSQIQSFPQHITHNLLLYEGILKMSTPTIDNADNSHDLDDVARLSSLMDRLTNRVDDLEKEKQCLNDEHEKLKARTVKLETLHKVFLQHVQDQNVTTASVESKFRKLEDGADEVKRLSSFTESEKTRLEDENTQLEIRIYNLEEKLKEKSVKLDDVYEKYVRLERLNTERAQEANRIKELLESKSAVGGGDNICDKQNRTSRNGKKRLEDELKTRTLTLDETLKDESVKLDDKCFRLEEKCVRLMEEKSVSLERSNIELMLEVNKIKESTASQSVVGGARNVISKVGFSAVLTHDVTLGPLQAIEYDKVITNIGNGYDARHGIFTVPINGLYIVSATTCSGPSQGVRTEIVRNGIQLAALYGDDYDIASHTIVVSLEQNDEVWVRHFAEGTSTVHAGGDRYYSSFSGVLVAAF
ncbi:Hypothetical predicted protein [Mytilus galloprovincialis]|uniref:C1q domain-containing protein n=1 Tax=Mytilus galloprovincialis TaxID=29158 RepID=A0A8B6HA99_MYTGA|nr:Hypothetical predicted protein [Mytilus galloprovincialis]